MIPAIAAGIGAVGSIVGGALGSDAAKDAAEEQADAAKKATAAQFLAAQQAIGANATATEPWRNIGAGGLYQLAHYMGIDPAQLMGGPTLSGSGNTGGYQPTLTTKTGKEGGLKHYADGRRISLAQYQAYQQQANGQVPGSELIPGLPAPGQYDPATFGLLTKRFGDEEFKGDPGYQWRLSQGLQGVENSGAARGMQLSGNMLAGLDEYGQGFASNEYQNAYNRFTNDQNNLYNRFAGLAQGGQQAAQQLGNTAANAISNYGNQAGQNMIGAGNANAAGMVGSANAWMGALNNIGNMTSNMYAMQQMFGNGNGGSDNDMVPDR